MGLDTNVNGSPPLELTAEQKAAITTRGVSIGLSAGAGCGKTFVLTERFLTHLEPAGGADSLSQVVAITFTDRAARQMRDRIRTACRQRLERCDPQHVPHWMSILRGIDAARISTIHSFCAGLLRRHAVAAGVDPRFGMLDDEMGNLLIRQSISRTVRRLLESGDSNCLKLVVHYGLEGTERHLRKLVSGRATIDAARFANCDAAQFADEWNRRLISEFLPRRIRELGSSETVERLLDVLSQNTSTNAEMKRRRAFLLAGFERLRMPQSTPVSFLNELREHAQVKGAGSKAAWPSEEIYEAVKDGFERLREQIDHLLEFTDFDVAAVTRAAELTAAAARLVEAASADLAAAKCEAGLLDFDDLLVRARDLLQGSQEVRNEAAGSIAALLVDEFQDTDPVQAEIVKALAGAGLESGKLFLVGDTRQSIYRFRRADPSVFEQMRTSIPEVGRLPLTKNFRSQPEILAFVNSLFAPVFGRDDNRLRPSRRQLSPRPCIEFLFALPEAEEADRAGDRRRREAEWMAARIRELLDDPTGRIPEKDPQSGETVLRRVRAGDVVILFRALSDVSIYEDVFRRSGVDYYLIGGRAFFAQQEVYDLVNLCGYLNDPDDAVSLVGVLRSPFFSLSDDTLCALAGRGQTLRRSLELEPPVDLSEPQREQVRHASRVLTELLRTKDRIPLAQLLAIAVEETGYDASLVHEFLGRRKVANLRKLIDMARQFDRSGLATLADFAQMARDSVTEETVEELAATHPETSDVVRLMTIHQAKGLEFPVVIVADMARPRRPSMWAAVYHRELGPLLPPPSFGDDKRRHPALEMYADEESCEDEMESLRILYVALTRAADYLILSAGLGAERRPKSGWLKLLGQRYDLGTGLPRGDAYLGALSGSEVTIDGAPEIRVVHQPPAPAGSRPSETRQEPLSRFREIVDAGETTALPRLLHPVSANSAGAREFSVSAIERADGQLRGGKPSWPQLLDSIDDDDGPVADDATLLGTVVHHVIERLGGPNGGQLDAIVRQTIRGLAPVEAKVVSQDAVIGRVQALVESEVWTELSGARRCFREIDFLLRWPANAADGSERALVSGKLDCLLETRSGHWKIIDYKTGRLPHRDPAAVFEHYRIQLVLYAEAVRAMIGRLPDAVEIVGVGEEVRRHSLALWPEFVEPVAGRIEAAIELLDRAGSRLAAAR